MLSTGGNLEIRAFHRSFLPKSTRLRLTVGGAIYAVGLVHGIAILYRVLF
ncbi:MAG: hypothetical protein QOK29_25 [Rhodospirillaceae bacterium]|jgi:hypothetical protein|nr:hypothetical protein [Rhodospirillaceae bacterium]